MRQCQFQNRGNMPMSCDERTSKLRASYLEKLLPYYEAAPGSSVTDHEKWHKYAQDFRWQVNNGDYDTELTTKKDSFETYMEKDKAKNRIAGLKDCREALGIARNFLDGTWDEDVVCAAEYLIITATKTIGEI